MGQNQLKESKKVAEVYIYFWYNDPGSKAYSALWAKLRRDWLINQHVKVGFTRDQISITEQSSRERLRKSCGFVDPSLSWAGIEIKEMQESGKGENKEN